MIMRSRLCLVAIFCFVALCLGSVPSQAKLISVEMKGAVTSKEFPLGAEFFTGEAFTFSYTFDPTALDVDGSDQNEQGFYLSSIKSAFLLIGDYALTAVGFGNIIIRDGAFGHDLYGILIEAPPFSNTRPGAILQGSSVAGRNPFGIVVTLSDQDKTAFNSDALPTALPDLSLFEGNEFELAFAESLDLGRAFGTARVYGRIDSIDFVDEARAVSEPTGLAIFGFGLAGIGFALLKMRSSIASKVTVNISSLDLRKRATAFFQNCGRYGLVSAAGGGRQTGNGGTKRIVAKRSLPAIGSLKTFSSHSSWHSSTVLTRTMAFASFCHWAGFILPLSL